MGIVDEFFFRLLSAIAIGKLKMNHWYIPCNCTILSLPIGFHVFLLKTFPLRLTRFLRKPMLGLCELRSLNILNLYFGCILAYYTGFLCKKPLSKYASARFFIRRKFCIIVNVSDPVFSFRSNIFSTDHKRFYKNNPSFTLRM